MFYQRMKTLLGFFSFPCSWRFLRYISPCLARSRTPTSRCVIRGLLGLSSGSEPLEREDFWPYQPQSIGERALMRQSVVSGSEPLFAEVLCQLELLILLKLLLRLKLLLFLGFYCSAVVVLWIAILKFDFWIWDAIRASILTSNNTFLFCLLRQVSSYLPSASSFCRMFRNRTFLFFFVSLFFFLISTITFLLVKLHMEKADFLKQ